MVADASPFGTPGDAVVVATEGDVARVSNISTEAGAYLLGTGDTGTAKVFATLGLGYGIMGLLVSHFMILPNLSRHPMARSTREKETDATKQNNLLQQQSRLPMISVYL